MNKKDKVRTYKVIGKHPHDVESCLLYNKECENRIPERNNMKQDEKTRLIEVRATSAKKSDIQLDLLDYINECLTELQQISYNDNRKNQKLVIVPIKSKKDNVTESRLVTLEKKERYQQLETSKLQITTFRSKKKRKVFYQ